MDKKGFVSLHPFTWFFAGLVIGIVLMVLIIIGVIPLAFVSNMCTSVK